MEDRRQFGEGAGLADPPRGIKRSDCRGLAAVEASPAACRAQRRAGAKSAGADVNAVQRSGTERTTATARILAERRFRPGYCTGQAAARPDRTLPHRSEPEASGGRKQGE